MRLFQDIKTGYWTKLPGGDELIHVHSPNVCEGGGCAIHNHPSDHPMKNDPLNWRDDLGILERICVHGIGHPDPDSAEYLERIGRGYFNIHGCDGCCYSKES